MTRRAVPLVLVGAEIEEIGRDSEGRLEYPRAVAVYLGDQELTRITGEDLVVHDGNVIIDETVAGWLSRLIGKLT